MVTTTTLPRIVPKPWGQETIFADTERYAGKILFVMAGHRLSQQYHRYKHETIYVMRGRVRALIGAPPAIVQEIELHPGDSLEIPPDTVHRFEALEDSEIFEVSSPELDDVVRLSDDYGRDT